MTEKNWIFCHVDFTNDFYEQIYRDKIPTMEFSCYFSDALNFFVHALDFSFLLPFKAEMSQYLPILLGVLLEKDRAEQSREYIL